MNPLSKPVVTSGLNLAERDAWQTESLLGKARLALSLAASLAVLMDRTEPSRYWGGVDALVGIYVLYSIGIMIYLSRARRATNTFTHVVHATDLVLPSLIGLLSNGPNSAFAIYYVLVIAAAASRWGMQAALRTAFACVGSMTVQVALMFLGVEGQLEVNRFLMRSAQLLILGYLVGGLADREKRLRKESLAVTQVLSRAQAKSTVRDTLHVVFEELLDCFEAGQAVLVLREVRSERIYSWNMQASSTELSLRELEASEAERWLGAPQTNIPWVWSGKHGTCIQQGGEYLAYSPPPIMVELAAGRSIMSAPVAMMHEFEGRILLFGLKRVKRDAAATLEFFLTMVRESLPTVYSAYLVRRLRSRAGAVERTRIARELHDGVIQSLIATELQIELLRRRGNVQGFAEGLSQMQQQIRGEVKKLRELMQHLRAPEVRPKDLLDYLANLVETFRHETGIEASFVSTTEEVNMPPRMSREVARIVQEALVNIRRHSGARTVLVSFGIVQGNWRLVVDDDGQGFDFAGRHEHEELLSSHRGPAIIKERVRLIGGQLDLESVPGRGARLEITLPRVAQTTYA
jgi:signal transduction histidine kinase